MTDVNGARFELRVWADRLDDVGDRLRSLGEPLATRESTDTYFVSSSTVAANPKARAELLDIKVLVGVREGFEQWGVHLKADFPVGSGLLTAELFPLLGLEPPSLERDVYSLPQLVGEVVVPHPDLAAVEVTKRRDMHMLLGCIAEITDATIDGRAFQTAAVESTDLTELRRARSALGLDALENVSYPRAIRSALGGRFADR